MNIRFVLKEYGLSEKEAEIYVALLPLGSINLQEIAKRVDNPRTTIYNTLNYLISKGLVSFIVKENVRYYEASDPEVIRDKIQEKKRLLESILPELRALKLDTKKSSSVEIFQGSKGLYTVLSDIFEKKQQTYYFGSYSLSKEILKHQPEHFRSIRLERKIPAKVVIDSFDEPTFHKKEYKNITEMRFHSSLKDFPCMVFIYGEKVALYTLKKDLVGVIISNGEVAKAMRFVFDLYWSTGKKVSL